MKFWSKDVYRVVLHLDKSTETPASSRGDSNDSVKLTHGQSPSLAFKDKSNDAPSKTTIFMSLWPHPLTVMENESSYHAYDFTSSNGD